MSSVPVPLYPQLITSSKTSTRSVGTDGQSLGFPLEQRYTRVGVSHYSRGAGPLLGFPLEQRF